MAENSATKWLMSCDSEERATASKERSRTQADDDDEEFPPRKLRHDVQQQPFSEPDLGVGSSSQCEGNSSSNKKFEVFISHRGPDTKRTFAYHMYDLLRDRGVEAFLDKEELQSGESFPLAIEEAIACSKVDVCILSRGFAESVWCLKELQMMVEKYEMGKSKLIPIFYDVEPCDVRRLQGAFGQGFQKIIDKNRYSRQLIDKWRHALYKIGEIKGEQGKGECCMAVVNKILDELDVAMFFVPVNLVGRQKELLSIKHDIMRCCQNGRGVTSVEISGVGGIGKTTFAKQLYNQICPQYKRCCFIEDVGGLVEKHGVKEVHNQLISKLLTYEPRNMRMEGKKLLMDRLHNAEILVVLDNIHIPLSVVFIEDDVCLNPRSIIIVTSREKAILKHDSKAAGYCQNLISLEISYLDFHTSEELFCQYAFGGRGNVSNEFNELIKKFVTKCQGIPLALIVVGRQLYRREIKFWKNLWNSIKNSLHPDVQKILKISYDHLDSELEKCLFLDVATFLYREKEVLLIQLRQCDDVLYALDKLKMKNLITVVDGVLMMHDLLVDLGRSIVKEEDSCPGRRSRVWHPRDVRYMLSNKMGSKKVKALNLISQGSAVLDEDGCPWPVGAFKKLSFLQFLILQGYCIQGDLSKLPKKLLWLKWIDFPHECIAGTLCLKSVRALHVSGERLKQLWEHQKEEEAPTNIRHLCLSDCMNLKRLPEFTAKFRHLSCIELRKCAFLETIPDSFGDLRSLRDLNISSCYRIKSLPESFGKLLQLQKLVFRWCEALECLPESFGELSQLKILELIGCAALQCLPESFGTLPKLKILQLSCRALRCLPESFGHLRQLQDLDIIRCPDVKVLPKSFGCLTNLLKVRVMYCEKIRLSAEQFQWLQRIHHLEISKWIAYPLSWEIAEAEQQNVDRWKNSKWHGQASQQQHLTLLVRRVSQGDADFLSDNNQHAPAQLSELELIIANHFLQRHGSAIHLPQQMHELAQSVGNLGHLKFLELSHCANVQWLPQSVGILQHLKTLRVRNCVNLHWLLDSAIGGLLSLELLELGSWFNSKVLPASVGNLSLLKKLFIDRCWNLEELPDTIGNLQNLTSLWIHDCIVLKELPSRLGNLSSLVSLCVSNCWMVEVIHTQGLLRLERLEVIACVKLRSIVGLSGLPNLLSLQITGCLNLTHVPGIGGCATSLRELRISGCYQLCLPNEGLVEHLPNQLDFLSLSLNHDSVMASLDKENKTLPNILQWSSHVKVHRRELNVKTSPLLFSLLEERVRHHLRTQNDSCYSFHRISLNTRVPCPPLRRRHGPRTAVLGFVSADDTVDFPLYVPPPQTRFTLAQKVGISNTWEGISNTWDSVFVAERSDFGEQVHICTVNVRGLFVNGGEFEIQGDGDQCYKAFAKEGWVILLDAEEEAKNELLAAEICNIFTSELVKQRWLSHAWTELPSQLCISEFSALDIAGCQITKISRHCNTLIMEEESGLTWKRRRCLFTDDHALLLEQQRRNSSKHSFLAHPRHHLDLEAGVLANLYEMSISMSIKGKLIHSRKLQQIVSLNEQNIPPALNTLLQTNASHSTLAALRRRKLEYIRRNPISFRFL